MTQPTIVEVIQQTRAPNATPARRIARAATLASFALLLGGIGIGDLLWGADPAAIARQQVIATVERLAPEADPAWFDRSPEPVPKHPVAPRMQQAWLRTPQLMFLCELNEALLRSLWQPGTGLSHVLGPDAPREFDVFAAPDGGMFPRFRYPPGATLPDGLTTNAFGFRGPDVAVDKPANTVRIAFVGASATVDGHYFAWSFPELIGHWFSLWAKAKGLDLRFEILNAGREAIGSPDIRAIVTHEVLPLAADYVIYYEGQNQFGVTDLLRHVRIDGEFTPGQPPADLVTDLGAADTRRPHWLDAFCSDSETARRLRRLLGTYRALPEPPKPPQSLALPAGLREDQPDLARAGELLQLGQILADLDGIRTACTATGAQLVVCSFDRLVGPGLRLELQAGHSVFSHQNRDYWPLSYDSIARLDALQNRYFEAWARARGVAFVEVAAHLPDEPKLFTDMVHATELGSRLRAWVMFAGLLPIVARDLASGIVPVPDTHPDELHPGRPPARRLTAAELEKR